MPPRLFQNHADVFEPTCFASQEITNKVADLQLYGGTAGCDPRRICWANVHLNYPYGLPLEVNWATNIEQNVAGKCIQDMCT